MGELNLSNGIRIEILDSDDRFCGIGRVWAGDVLLRSDNRPMLPEIRTPDGIKVDSLKIDNVTESPEGVVLECPVLTRADGIMEYMVHEVRQRYNTGNWAAEPQPAPDAKLQITLKPVERKVGSRTLTGFSYQYSWSSEEYPIYRILDRATWELGGNIVGSEFWLRHLSAPSIFPVASKEQFYSSEWFLPDCHNPNVFQFFPFQTELQGFTFTSAEVGTLITWATEVAHIRSLFEKPRNEDVMVHLHEHCGDLAGTFSTSPIEVLFLPGKLTRVEKLNLHNDMMDLVYDALHAQVGMERERVEPYGQIEEWTLPDMDVYADEAAPALIKSGAKVVEVANHFENNMNTWGVSNMCCTVDYKVAETVGADKLKRLCDNVKAGGGKVGMWANTSISTLTQIFRNRNKGGNRIDFLPKEGSIVEALEKAKIPFVRNASGAIEADHYTPVFAVLNLRDPIIREYWLRRWGEAHDNIGLEGIFLDSSFNLSSDKFHWQQNAQEGDRTGATADQTELLGNFRPPRDPKAAILSQYRAHLDLMTEMQKIGYYYCNEDLGVFGTHRHGPEINARLDSLPMWNECYTGFDAKAIKEAGYDPDDIFFRGLAYRTMWMLRYDLRGKRVSWNYGGVRGDYDIPTDRQISLLNAFAELNNLMVNREILPDEKAVVYRPEGKQVLWSFDDLDLPLDGPKTIRNVLTGEVQKTDKLAARKHQIYVID